MANFIAKKPLIGLTLDFEAVTGAPPLPGHFSAYDYYALRSNYAGCLADAGAVPLMLPHEPLLAAGYADLLDGLVVTGDGRDIDPQLYGQAAHAKTTVTRAQRTLFEQALVAAMLHLRKPILAICGGMQLLNVKFGGSLIQHIPDEVGGALEHQQSVRHMPVHEVRVVAGTLLHRIVGGAASLAVNSDHHQAVKDLGQGLIVNAVAPDGVIEGIEMLDYPFCLGVVWHPEFAVGAGDSAILTAFVQACGAVAS
jgi:putative glutamine amidotransferase